MARRRKTNLLEDLVSVFALLPWWLCLALAVGSYFVLHGLAVQPAEATAFAAGRNVQLVDGMKLFGMLQQARAANTPVSSAPLATPRPTATAASAMSTAPSCPVCAAAMVSRTARKGANPGNAFWGCSGFPACKGTRAAAV